MEGEEAKERNEERHKTVGCRSSKGKKGYWGKQCKGKSGSEGGMWM